MAVTSIDVINAAATRAGNGQITSFQDGSAESVIASANYQQIVDDSLTEHPWSFAQQTAYLDKLADDPITDGQAAFQLPNDLLRLLSVRDGDAWYGRPLKYKVRGGRIVTFRDVERPAALYLGRVDESNWPGWFREIVITRLEILFLRAINEDDARADRRQDELDRVKIPRARTNDSQQNAPRDKMQSQLIAARRR